MTGAPVPTSEATAARTSRALDRFAGSERIWFWTIVGVAIVPLVISALRLEVSIRGRYRPVSDLALIEMTVRDIGHHTVVYGAYSRFGWHHPGPLMFYLLAPTYRVLGSTSVAVDVGALVVNAVVIIGVALVARRRGGLPLVLCTMLPLALLVHALGTNVIRNPWNPFLPLLSLFLLVLLAWSLAVGDAAALPWAVAVASFEIQSHVGYAPVAGALLAWGTFALVVRTWRQPPSVRPDVIRRLARIGSITLAVGVALWLLPLYGQFVDHDHNLANLAHFFLHAPPGAGFATSARAVGLEFTARPEWIVGSRAGYAFLVLGGSETAAWLRLGAFAVVFVASAALIARVRHVPELLMLAITIVIAMGASIYGVSNIVGIVAPYLTQWTWSVGAAAGVLVLWGGWLALSERARAHAGPALAGVVALGICGLSAGQSVDAIRSGPLDAPSQPMMRSVTHQVLENLQPGSGPVRFTGRQELSTEELGLVLQLERHEIPVRVDGPDAAFHYGATRSSLPGPYRAVLTVLLGPDATGFAPRDGEHVLARFTQPFSEAEIRAEQRLVDAVRRREGDGSPALVKLEQQLQTMRTQPKEAVAIVARPQG